MTFLPSDLRQVAVFSSVGFLVQSTGLQRFSYHEWHRLCLDLERSRIKDLYKTRLMNSGSLLEILTVYAQEVQQALSLCHIFAPFKLLLSFVS